MTTEDRPVRQRGICPVCSETRMVTTAGVMRDHRGDIYRGGWRQQCAGVGQPPKSVVADPIAAAEARGRAAAIAELSDAHHEGFGAGMASADEDLDKITAAAESRGWAAAIAALRAKAVGDWNDADAPVSIGFTRAQAWADAADHLEAVGLETKGEQP